MECAIEAKATSKIKNDNLKGLRELAKECCNTGLKKIIVCLEEKSRITDDGIIIMPYREFSRKLWKGELLSA